MPTQDFKGTLTGINLAGTAAKTITVTQDTSLDEAVPMSSKMAKTGSNLAIGADADGDMYYRVAGVLARLAKGAANLRLFMNAGATAPEWAKGMASGILTRDMTAASGDVSYTGLGFKPSVIIFSGGVSTKAVNFYFGYADAAVGAYCMWNYTYTTAGAVAFNNAKPIVLVESGSQSQQAVMKTYDADGFTLTWELAGTPTAGTAEILYIAFR